MYKLKANKNSLWHDSLWALHAGLQLESRLLLDCDHILPHLDCSGLDSARRHNAQAEV
jgi:hypothetical protein